MVSHLSGLPEGRLLDTPQARLSVCMRCFYCYVTYKQWTSKVLNITTQHYATAPCFSRSENYTVRILVKKYADGNMFHEISKWVRTWLDFLPPAFENAHKVVWFHDSLGSSKNLDRWSRRAIRGASSHLSGLTLKWSKIGKFPIFSLKWSTT